MTKQTRSGAEADDDPGRDGGSYLAPLTPEEQADRDHWISQLRKAIEVSGLSARQFARVVLVREDRTVRRYLAGDRKIPGLIREKISQLLAAKPTRRRMRKPPPNDTIGA